jgi:hypothetical protein
MTAPKQPRLKALKAGPPSLRVRISRELDAKLRYMEAVTGLSRSDVVRLLLRRACAMGISSNSGGDDWSAMVLTRFPDGGITYGGVVREIIGLLVRDARDEERNGSGEGSVPPRPLAISIIY